MVDKQPGVVRRPAKKSGRDFRIERVTGGYPFKTMIQERINQKSLPNKQNTTIS